MPALDSLARAPRRPRRAKRKDDWVDEIVFKFRSTAKIYFGDLGGVLTRPYSAEHTATRVDQVLFALGLTIPDAEILVTLAPHQRHRLEALRAEIKEAERWSTAALDAARRLR